MVDKCMWVVTKIGIKWWFELYQCYTRQVIKIMNVRNKITRRYSSSNLTTNHVCVALYVWCHQISKPLHFEIKTIDLWDDAPWSNEYSVWNSTIFTSNRKKSSNLIKIENFNLWQNLTPNFLSIVMNIIDHNP